MNLNDLGFDLEPIVSELTEDISKDSLGDPSKALLPPHAQKARLKVEVFESLNNHYLRLANGMNYLLTRLQQMAEAKEPLIDRQVFDEILTKLDEKRSDELTKDEITALHISAIDIYNSKEYDHAADAFYALTELDPGQSLFWKLIGNANFHIGKFKEAVDAYSMALIMNEKDLESMVYQARCLEGENCIQEAIDILSQARDIIKNNPEFKSWDETVSALIEKLKK